MTKFCIMCGQKLHSTVHKAFERKCWTSDKNRPSYTFILFIEIEAENVGLSVKHKLKRHSWKSGRSMSCSNIGFKSQESHSFVYVRKWGNSWSFTNSETLVFTNTAVSPPLWEATPIHVTYPTSRTFFNLITQIIFVEVYK
jgi:hypothetical protein